MRIGIDIDDTITDTNSLIEQILIENNLSSLSSDFDSHLESDLKTYDSFIRENIDNVMKYCPVKKDACEVIKALKDNGNEIYIITARSNYYSDKIYDITVSFLKEHGIIYDKLIFNCSDKKSVCLSNKIDIMLDDKALLIDSLKDTDTKGILFTASYNKKYIYDRVDNWLEFKELVDNWR